MRSHFFQLVYEVVRRIPYGRVASYGQIAALLEHPHAARTVGWALHGLPDGSDVPWHRVINSQGRCSTSSFSEPPDLQQQLLEAEGVEFDASSKVDLRRFGWNEWSPLPRRETARMTMEAAQPPDSHDS